MKKLLFTIVALSTILSAERFPADQRDLAGRIIQAIGYQCSSVDSASRHITSNKIDVYCDGYAVKYVLQNVGGQWKVTLR